MAPSSHLEMKKATKNVVQYGKAFGPSGYRQITWHFQTGPWHNMTDRKRRGRKKGRKPMSQIQTFCNGN